MKRVLFFTAISVLIAVNSGCSMFKRKSTKEIISEVNQIMDRPHPKTDLMNLKGPKYVFHNVEFVENYDGDTFTANIKQLHPIVGLKMKVRLKGVDAPEKYGRKPCEREKAAAATLLTQQTLWNAKKIMLTEVQRGTFFRLVANVYVDDVLLQDILLAAKLAVPYELRDQKDSWCD